LLIKNIISVLCRVAKRLSYIEDACCLKVKRDLRNSFTHVEKRKFKHKAYR